MMYTIKNINICLCAMIIAISCSSVLFCAENNSLHSTILSTPAHALPDVLRENIFNGSLGHKDLVQLGSRNSDVDAVLKTLEPQIKEKVWSLFEKEMSIELPAHLSHFDQYGYGSCSDLHTYGMQLTVKRYYNYLGDGPFIGFVKILILERDKKIKSELKVIK
jgi:hypothetical protein